MNFNTPPSVLSIAGTDPSGGAGIQADLKAISATGGYAATVITALVAQNTQGVKAIQEIPSDFVAQQIDCVFSDLDIRAVKIGMLHDARIIRTIAQALEQWRPPYVVFDPVMVAKDGSLLLELETIALLKTEILPKAYLITPNIYEAEQLLNTSIQTSHDMESAAQSLGNTFGTNVLMKGGHLKGEDSADVLYQVQKKTYQWFYAQRVLTQNTHGTGCTLSSAIASYLAQGYALENAVDAAKVYLTQAIQTGQSYRIGKGNGPVDHFYRLRD